MPLQGNEWPWPEGTVEALQGYIASRADKLWGVGHPPHGMDRNTWQETLARVCCETSVAMPHFSPIGWAEKFFEVEAQVMTAKLHQKLRDLTAGDLPLGDIKQAIRILSKITPKPET